MSPFWSGWVKVLVVLNLGITFLLLVWALGVRIPTAPDGTTGHVWAHGVLREGVRRLPRWWVAFSVSMFVAGCAYLVMYPGFGNFSGLLDWTSQRELREQTVANDARLERILALVRGGKVESLARNAGIVALGGRLYSDNCAACHGAEGRGNPIVGAPDLTDTDWLYAGDGESIVTSILEGRSGVMPAWGTALGQGGVNEVAAYVASLGGRQAPADWIAAGRNRYAAMCVACHGVEGRGNALLGAPDLTDGAWLYGGDFARIVESIREGRNGVMPAWRARLGEDQARIIAAWVMAQSRESAAPVR